MNQTTLEVLDALQSDASIPRSVVLGWMRDPDLETRAVVYQLTDKAWARIKPELSMKDQCSFMGTYLLECLKSNREDEDYVHSGFEAAWELARWLKHLVTIEGTEKIVREVIHDLESLYRDADDKTRNRIETGAIEHIFENRALREHFARWREDPVLKTAYEECLAWGKTHEQ